MVTAGSAQAWLCPSETSAPVVIGSRERKKWNLPGSLHPDLVLYSTPSCVQLQYPRRCFVEDPSSQVSSQRWINTVVSNTYSKVSLCLGVLFIMQTARHLFPSQCTSCWYNHQYYQTGIYHVALLFSKEITGIAALRRASNCL